LLASRWVRLAWPEITARGTVVPARIVSAVGLELRARRRRRVASRVAVAACGSLAVAAAGIVAWTWVEHRQPVALRSGSSPPTEASARDESTDEALWVRLAATSPEREVVPGDTFRAVTGGDAAGVRLASTDGTELVVEPGGVLQVVEAGATKRFTLQLGAVQVRVRKLRPGERFLIDTPEAEVEVHGTRFRVTRAEAATGAAAGSGPSRCAGAASTVVSVSEGVVSVAGGGGEARLSPGGTWSSPCAAPVASASLSVSASGAAGPRPRPDRERPRWLQRRHRDALLSPSQLAAQNDLFVAAARARRQGHPSQALDLFERFVDTYPDSSLLESALVQRMRLLRGSGTPGAAAQAATRYLGQFPDGFARTEAEQVLGVVGASAPASPNRDR
jgi:TolA-binding protein